MCRSMCCASGKAASRQIKPVKRAGGRRYYRPDDVDLLRGIRALLYVDGLTIKGVQKILKERGLRHVAMIGRGQAPAPMPRRRPNAGESAEKAGGEEASQPFARGAVADQPAFLRHAGNGSVWSRGKVSGCCGHADKDDKVTGANGARAALRTLLAELEGLKKGLKRARKH